MGKKADRPSMLDLWTGGQVDNGAPPPRNPVGGIFKAALTFLAIALAVYLAKYAVDVLMILLTIAVVGLVLHIVGSRLAEANLLNPGPILIFAFAVGLFVYAFVAPSGALDALAKKAPAPVVRFFEWSAEHGWARRAIVDTDKTVATDSGNTASEPEPAAPSPISVVLPAAPAQAGQPVVLRAQLPAGSGQKEVRFYDGSTLLGVGTVRVEGAYRVAEFTVPGLSAGEHEITAQTSGMLGLRVQRSAPVRYTVR